MRARRDQHRAAGDLPLHCSKRCWIGRRRRHVEFQIAADKDALGAERAQALRVGRSLREKQARAADHGTRQGREPPPRTERPLRHPCVDDRQRKRTSPERVEHRRPELRLHEEREVRLPVIEESPDRGGCVDRHELMDRVTRKARLGNLRGCHCACRQEQHQITPGEPVDQRHGCDRLTDTCAMHPHQRPRRAWLSSDAPSLATPRDVFLAVARPQAKQRAGDRRSDTSDGAVKRQRGPSDEAAEVVVGQEISPRRRQARARRRVAASAPCVHICPAVPQARHAYRTRRCARLPCSRSGWPSVPSTGGERS